MISVSIFCVAVTALCCYMVHILLVERKEISSELQKALREADQVALRKPLKIVQPKGSQVQKDRYGNIIDVTAISRKLHRPNLAIRNKSFEQPKKTFFNKAIRSIGYPITPNNQSGTGYGFDVRV